MGWQGRYQEFKEETIMVVQHNLTAMNANRQLSGVQSAQRSQQRSYHQEKELTKMVINKYINLRKDEINQIRSKLC